MSNSVWEHPEHGTRVEVAPEAYSGFGRDGTLPAQDCSDPARGQPCGERKLVNRQAAHLELGAKDRTGMCAWTGILGYSWSARMVLPDHGIFRRGRKARRPLKQR